MPIIDEQTVEVFERKLLAAYTNSHTIRVMFYDNGHVNVVEEGITSIDQRQKVLVDQIVSVI